MGKVPALSVVSDDVLLVESKWSFLPITPTYDEYVEECMTIPFPQREGFDVLTRSAMKQLCSSIKSLVHFDRFKKCSFFKIRVDVCHRVYNYPEDRVKRAGLGGDRRRRLVWSNFLSWYAWSQSVTTDRQYYDWLSSRRAGR